MNFINKTLITILILCCPAILIADTQAPEFVLFYGDVTINSNPAPIGTVIDAFDPDNVNCGSFTVGDNSTTAGNYGFLYVRNDDNTTPGIDEGAVSGDVISFKINGLDATVLVDSGSVIWTSNGTVNIIHLSTSTQTVSFNTVFLPADTLVAPGWTVKLKVGLENTGNGLDFYGVTSLDDTAASPGWTTVDQDTVSHADVGATAYVYFDVNIPLFGGGGDTAFVVHYTVFSHVDPTVTYEDSVTLYKSITNVDDNGLAILPGQFTLSQNYPNPFNPSTTIAFNLPFAAKIRFEVINSLGQIVKSRELGMISAGEHSIEFDATAFASGVYFYRLSSDNYSDSKKMMLLK